MENLSRITARNKPHSTYRFIKTTSTKTKSQKIEKLKIIFQTESKKAV